MQKKFILSLIITIIGFTAFGQQLPVGTCGIIHMYDDAGNRTKRMYYCNNGGNYPTTVKQEEIGETTEFQYVDALYPNPTTGKFSITFSKELKNAKVFVTDINGKVISSFKASGFMINFDLSGVASGVYFVRIDDAGNIISKKVVKQ